MTELIDLLRLGNYKENNRLEAKRALGGLPKSLWETYSAFANTLGGVILLGVEEHRDKTLHAIDLPAPHILLEEFWNLLNNPRFVSVNILSNRDVTVEEIEGRHIIVITVPRAPSYLKPIYVEGNPLTGTYRRNGEGDYRCSKEEVGQMLKEAANRTPDMRVLEKFSTAVFDSGTLGRYREQLNILRPGHLWGQLEQNEFLYKIGAIDRLNNGEVYPTCAGLLLFGRQEAIKKEFPAYHLRYREFSPTGQEPDFQLDSDDTGWSGNLFDFYCQVYARLANKIVLPEDRDIELDFSDTPVHKAVREALSNCLVNGNYYDPDVIDVTCHDNLLTFAGNNGFRIDSDKNRAQGLGEAANMGILKIFNLVGIAERAISGLPQIFAAWRHEGWELPALVQQDNPPRLTISLAIRPISNSPFRRKNILPKQQVKELIIAHLTTDICVEITDLVRTLGISGRQARQILAEMESEGIITESYGFLTRYYKLKA